MDTRERSRRDVLKTGTALASVGILGGLSGCSGLLDDSDTADGDNGGASGTAGDIPARANIAMSMSFDAVLNDQAVRGAVNNALSEQSSTNSMVPSSISEAFEQAEQQAGVDPRKLNEIVLFGETSPDGSNDYVGWLAYTDWTQDELTTLIEESGVEDMTTEEYNGTTVYVNDDADDTTERMAILGDGTVVLGRSSATEDVIDLRNGNGDSISGDLLSAWNETSGDYASVAMNIESEDLPSGQAEAAQPTVEDINYAYGSIYADGDMRGVRLNLETDSAQSAEDVKTFIDGQLALAVEEAEDPQGRQFLEDIETSTSGSTVVIENEVDVDTITPVIEQFVTLFVLRVTQSTEVHTDGPSVSV